MSFNIVAFPEMEILGFWCGNFRYRKPRICRKHFKSFDFVQKVKSSVAGVAGMQDSALLFQVHAQHLQPPVGQFVCG